MEDVLITFAVENGMKYDDYFISIGGHVIFRCYDKKKKEKWYSVESWTPFRCQSWK